MATDILISDITNSTTVSNGISNGTGVFDKLMNTVNLYLNDQYTSGRLKGPDYANVLLGSIQSIIAQSMSYTLQEKVQEAQVDKINSDKEIAEAQSAKDLLLKDAELALKQSQKAMMDQQKLTEVQQTARATYENSTLLVDQHNTNLKQLEAIDKDIDVKERTIVLQEKEIDDKLLTSAKQRLLLDIQEQAEQYKVDVILPAEVEKLVKDIEVAERSIVIQEKQSVQDLLNKQSQKAIMDQQKLTETQQTALVGENVTNAKIAQQTGLQTLNMAVIDRTNKKYTDKVSGITTYGQYTLSGGTLTYTSGNPA